MWVFDLPSGLCVGGWCKLWHASAAQSPRSFPDAADDTLRHVKDRTIHPWAHHGKSSQTCQTFACEAFLDTPTSHKSKMYSVNSCVEILKGRVARKKLSHRCAAISMGCWEAGGLGQAALQIAQAAGARVVATAGSQDKRSYLRSTCHVDAVVSSRSTHFADAMAYLASKGENPTVVLNSLTSPGIPLDSIVPLPQAYLIVRAPACLEAVSRV